jgi:RNA-binding protein
MPLSGKALRYLRGLAHGLDPVVHVGKEGVTRGLIGAVDRALLDHELIKVRVLLESPMEPRDAAEVVSIQTSSTMVQVLGRTFLVYRPHPETPKIVLPKKGG